MCVYDKSCSECEYKDNIIIMEPCNSCYMTEEKKGFKKMEIGNEVVGKKMEIPPIFMHTNAPVGYESGSEENVQFYANNKPINSGMSEIAKEEFITRMKGLSEEEMELLIDILPIEMCFERIGREIDRAKSLENSLIEMVKRAK